MGIEMIRHTDWAGSTAFLSVLSQSYKTTSSNQAATPETMEPFTNI